MKCAKHPAAKVVLKCPECVRERRAEASRENGRKGGRGRKKA